MKVISLEQLSAALVCPACRGGALQVLASTGSRVRCERCHREYGLDGGVLSFLIDEQLSETNRNEITANAVNPADREYADAMIHKEDWRPLHTRQMNWVVDFVSEMFPNSSDRDLFTLGAGVGFDLRLLLRRTKFARVYASDISPTATALIERALENYPGELGLFASEFGLCPVAKRPNSVGLVFQALHHAPDAHAALEALMDHSFDDLVIVEPTTNPPLKLLAKFDLVQRVEYSGTRPDWMSIPRIEAIAAKRGYTAQVRTWWEIPPYLAPKWVDTMPVVADALYGVFDVVSRVTEPLHFGSMAAIRLHRQSRD